MEYITKRRARFVAACGSVNLPWGTVVEEVDGVLVHNGLQLCAAGSQNAFDYFARNDDRKGHERGRLTTAIMDTLAHQDADHQTRWDRVWEDPRCQKYRRADHTDFWLWGRAFFEAPVEDLRHIAALVGAVKGVGR